MGLYCMYDKIYKIYDYLYTLCPNFINFCYRLYYKVKFPKSEIYLSLPKGVFKKLEIGDYSHSNSIIEVQNVYNFNVTLKIGKYTHIGKRLQILCGSPHTPNYVANSIIPIEDKKDIVVYIGSDVWIGNDVILIANKSISIGDGAVIGAGSIVTHSIDSYSISAGVPAKHIRYRFNKKIRKGLLSIRWWDWNKDKISKNSIYFRNPKTFITKFLNEK